MTIASCETCRAVHRLVGAGVKAGEVDAVVERDIKPENLLPSNIDARLQSIVDLKRAQEADLGPEGDDEPYETVIRRGIVLGLQSAIDRLRATTTVQVVDPLPPTTRKPKQVSTLLGGSSPGGALGKCELAILAVLAQRRGKSTTAVQVGILAGYSPTSGGFNAALATLRAEGLIEGLTITSDGVKRAGNVEPMPTGIALVRYWQAKLDKAEAAMLGALVAHHPKAMGKEQLGERTGYSPTSGGFNAALAKLRALELITRGREIRPASVFFEGGR